MQNKITVLVQQRKDYQTAKSMFIQQYEVLSKYFYQIRKNENAYTPSMMQGEFLNDGTITENEGAKAAQRMTSAIVGSVWKDAKNTIRIKPSKNILVTEDVKPFYVQLNNDLGSFVDRDRSEFLRTLTAAVHDAVIYGTGGAAIHQGTYTTPLKFQNKSPMSFYLGYNKNGEIDTIIVDYPYTAKELVDRYGMDRVGSTVADAHRRNDQIKRFVLTQTITPRKRNEKMPELGALSMPFASYVFLPNENIFLEEGGYESLPLKVLFFRKLEHEGYGRGPGMDALPTVIQSGIAAEILAVGAELTALPALGMFDDGTFGGKTLNLSSGGVNVFNVASNMFPSEKPIFPIFTVGDLSIIFEYWKILRERIYEYFLLDKMYDLNNQGQQMTYGESLIRNNIRSDALSGIFTQTMFFINSIIERSVDILYSMGLAGVPDPLNESDPKVVAMNLHGLTPMKIPDAVLQAMETGLDWYEIEHISPAARIMKSEELQSVTMFMQLIGQAGQVDQEFLDCIDPDGTADKLKEVLSTDLIMLRTPEAKEQRRQFRMQMQMEAAKVEAERIQSQTNQSNAQAAAAQTGAMRNLLNPEGGKGGQF